MKTVDAITDKKQLLSIKTYLQNRSARDYCLFLLGINTGIRIHDLLHLYVKDIMTESGDTRQYLSHSALVDPPIYLNKEVRQTIQSYILQGSLQYDDFLFKSRKRSEPITRQQAYRIINEAAKQAGIEGSIGTHTLRKTFGYHAYTKGIAISLIQKRLQQSNPSETRQYIGVPANKSILIKLDVNL
ncbi:tyrosine-type recombinase/integrase [Bacillus sp. MRMR6]|uniref:tyrosine-type recombinase/integrase n=1 Tax=Bacillus sp. MRMR6 TaxID=1928617 RepID=UPI000951F92D|nr:tyrosine-type recombinase/integrase [Bacillus sp. MRMR6]OLS39958.1 DNA integration/recombination/inversion protein [Bacillus sp. MRMR6]